VLTHLVIVLFFIYEKIKYHDDGFEKVTGTEFLTIHITFPVTNAWISYTLAYVLFINFTNYCNFTVLQLEATCKPNSVGGIVCTNNREAVCGSIYLPGTDQTLDPLAFYQTLFTWPTVAVLVVLAAEAAMNLAYYKDIIFATVVTLNFVFMWYQNFIKVTQQQPN